MGDYWGGGRGGQESVIFISMLKHFKAFVTIQQIVLIRQWFKNTAGHGRRDDMDI